MRRQVALFIKSKTQEDGTCAKQDSSNLHNNYALISFNTSFHFTSDGQFPHIS